MDVPDLHRYGFTPIEERIVLFLLSDLSVKDTAEFTRSTVRYVRKCFSQIYGKVGCRHDRASLVLALLTKNA